MTKANESCDFVIEPDGVVKAIYSELVSLDSLGSMTITRGSHVEPDEQGLWHADLSPSHGPVLGPFNCRSDAIDAEIAWLTKNWLKV
jgi:hypothetical protein